MDSLILKSYKHFQNQTNGKATHCFTPKPQIFKMQ